MGGFGPPLTTVFIMKNFGRVLILYWGPIGLIIALAMVLDFVKPANAHTGKVLCVTNTTGSHPRDANGFVTIQFFNKCKKRSVHVQLCIPSGKNFNTYSVHIRPRRHGAINVGIRNEPFRFFYTDNDISPCHSHPKKKKKK